VSRFVKLLLAFLLIIGLLSAMFSGVAIFLIGNRVVEEAQNRVESDLNASREMYAAYSAALYDLVRFSADRFYLRNALLAGVPSIAAGELLGTMLREGLDYLSLTGPDGVVTLRVGNPGAAGDSQAADLIVAAVLENRLPAVGSAVFAAERLGLESPEMVEQARLDLVETQAARPREETVETSGLVLQAAAPILDYNGEILGVLYAGRLLNRRFEIVDLIKETVFAGESYQGEDIGTATIFLDDVRVATNVLNEDGTRALGTRVSDEVYEQVIVEGQRWVGRAYLGGTPIGMLYVGILEQPYIDLRTRTTVLFAGIALAGVVLAVGVSIFISRRLSTPVRALVKASRQVAEGNLDAQVPVRSRDELGTLAGAFNSMAAALKARDDQLKEFARRKVMESERLAVVGQLAADVAHELNNPMQGIVTYSHLLLERLPADDERRGSVEKIATQANRCTTIVRALLDFSRPKKPEKRLASPCAIIDECFSLVEDRALFHNIEVVRDYAACIPEVVVDPAQMQQVFMNLIINAAEAMGGVGRLSVTARFEAAREAIQITFRDSGHGISEEDMGRIFDPFFTTKEVGHGTGLGLAISFGIVKEHGGTITVDSEVGVGTAFTIELPIGSPAEVVK
jgi:two-component system NtrC family sensor kinase